ncbi:hypothetical protein [Pseudomonas phage PSA28]|nr:hypothetical protein [Pseudomonas phage PSA28]
MDLNKVKARIAKLLAMAENNGNEHEAAQAADRARRLMDQYQLDRMDVEQTASDFGYEYAGESYAFQPRWKGWLASAVAKFNDCQCRLVRVPSDGARKRYRTRWEGYAEDVTLCLAMFEYFTTVVENATSKDQLARGYTRYNARVGTIFKEHMVSTLSERLRVLMAQRQTETTTATGTGLAVYKANQVAAQFGECTYKEQQTKPADKMTPEEKHAALMGIQEGEAVHINALN